MKIQFLELKSTLFILAFYLSLSLHGQTLIQQISSFNASNLNAINCQGGFTITDGSSLCVTDLEGSCVSCGIIENQFGANNSSYRINNIDVSDYCTVSVKVIASGSSANGEFEDQFRCGTDRIRLHISSAGEIERTDIYPNGNTWSGEFQATLTNTDDLLNITIEIGTQEANETLCIEEIQIIGDDTTFIGANCDDGNPDTMNDRIGEDCNCGGTSVTPSFDCINALTLNTLVYRESRTYDGTGEILDEIKDGETCMFDQDERGTIWYTFTTNGTGELAFLITPEDENADLDWALFDISNASCDDLSVNPAALLASCNAAGGGDCHGATGMTIEGIYDLQGGGCGSASPSINQGNNPINVAISITETKTYALAIQNWTYIDQGTFDSYTIDFSASSVSIGDSAPRISNIEASSSICDNDPITLVFDQPMRCDNLFDLQVELIDEAGVVYPGRAFAGDCLRQEVVVSELVINADFRGAKGGTYRLIIEDTPTNRTALTNEEGVSMMLPVELTVDLLTDNSLNVSILNRTPRNNICEGDNVTLRAEESFDFLGTSNLYTWTLPDGNTFIRRELQVTMPGIYTVHALQNGARVQVGCRRGSATYTLGTIGDAIAVTNWVTPNEICDNIIEVTLDNEVICRALETLEFNLVGPEGEAYEVTNSTSCELEVTNKLRFRITPFPKNIGTYSFSLTEQAATNTTLTNLCEIYANTPENLQSILSTSFAITEYSIPDLSISFTGTEACDEITLKADRAGFFIPIGFDFEWRKVVENGTSTIIGTTQEITITEAGLYTVRAANGCSVGFAEINIDSAPVLTATINGETNLNVIVCSNEQITLTANPGASYEWSNGAHTQSITVNAAGTYIVQVTNNNGCINDASATINRIAPPTISLPDEPLCAADNQTYSVRINTEAENTLTTTTGIVTGSNGFLTVYNIPTGQAISVTVTTPTDCSISQSIPAPSCNEDCPSINAPISNGNRSICADEPIPVLSVSSAGLDADSEIRWYTTATGGTSILRGADFVPTQAGTYYAEIYNTSTACTSPRTAIRLTINPAPIAIITGNATICTNQMTQLTASLQNDAVASFQWSTGSTSSNIAVSAGMYSVIITDANGCESEASVRVEEAPSPSITFPSNPDCTADGQNYSIRINTEAENTLTTSAGIVAGSSGFLTVYNIPTGQAIIITITNPEGCEVVESIAAPDCSCPSYPTPQSDGNQEICEGQTIVPLSVSVESLHPDWEVRWYLSATDNIAIAKGLSFTPIVAGTYYAEVYDKLNACTSARTAVTLTIVGCNTPTINALAAQAQPNPFRTTTTLQFKQISADWVELVVYDISGKVLVQERQYQEAGSQKYSIKANQLGNNGVYFYRLQNSTQSIVGKLILQ